MDRDCWRGVGADPVLDAVVIDRHVDRLRQGRRTLVDLCTHYGMEIGNAHDASADAIASVGVLFALAERYEALGECELARAAPGRRSVGTGSGRGGTTSGAVTRVWPDRPRDYVWPVAPAVLWPAA